MVCWRSKLAVIFVKIGSRFSSMRGPGWNAVEQRKTPAGSPTERRPGTLNKKHRDEITASTELSRFRPITPRISPYEALTITAMATTCP